MASVAASSESDTSAIRAAFAARCVDDDSPPGAWRFAAASVGVSGADAFLRHLSRSIFRALENLAASAEAARARINAVRDAALLRCDELESRIEATETFKRVALEHELCAVDAALERLREERSTGAAASASLDDAELEAQLIKLTGRLDAADAQLLALPTTVVEPPHVGLVVEETAALAAVLALGRVIAPRAVTAADLTLEVASSYARPGDTLQLRVALQSAHHTSQSDEELEISLGAAAAATHVEATLKAEGGATQPLKADVSTDVSGRCVKISISIPSDALVGSLVCFGPLTVSGQPVSGLLGPLVVKVRGVRNMNT
jgi:hypothetical protein